MELEHKIGHLLFLPIRGLEDESGLRSMTRRWKDWARLRPGGGIVFGARPDLAHRFLQSTGPLVLAADLERGAGQQFSGATILPCPMALAAAGGEVVEELASATAREARALGE